LRSGQAFRLREQARLWQRSRKKSGSGIVPAAGFWNCG
jgi:hypothetical protein